MTAKKIHNPYFDFLRGVAILMVVGIHTYHGRHSLNGTAEEAVKLFLINFFNCAVPLFLALSGFFIARKNLNTMSDCTAFWRKQIPTVYVPCLIFSIPWFVISCISGGGIISKTANLLLCGYSVYYFIALIIECYLLAPLLVRHNNRATLWLVCAMSVAASLALEYIRFVHGRELPLIVRGSFPGALIFFYIGIYLSKHRRDYSLWLPVVLIVTGLCLGLLQMEYVRNHYGISAHGQKTMLFLFEAGVILLCMSEKCEKMFRLNPATRPLLYIGEISFGIYFTHVYLIELVMRFAPQWHEQWALLWLLSVVLTVALIATVKRIAPNAARKYLGTDKTVMKIGIVTQPLWGNYGGLMQNYALQQVLRRMGHEPVTIDYIWNIKWPRYVLTTLKTALLWLVPGKRRAFAQKFPKRTNPLTDAFVKDHIATTRYVYSYRPGTLRRHGIEALVTGSDQVWRPRYNPDLPDMYLDFARSADIRKIAYAASFGTAEHEYTPEQIERCRPAARRLHAVGVREQGAVKLCKDYFDIDAQQVLDPTLLLSKEDYEELTRDIPVAKERYVGVYVLDDSPEIDRVIQKVCRDRGLSSVRRISENDTDTSPEDWIAMIRDASFVVTNSFHGTVFAIIFGKPFISLYNRTRGADRFNSLLKPLGLQRRLLDPEMANDIERISGDSIDWTHVKKVLEARRAESLDYLRNNLM